MRSVTVVFPASMWAAMPLRTTRARTVPPAGASRATPRSKARPPETAEGERLNPLRFGLPLMFANFLGLTSKDTGAERRQRIRQGFADYDLSRGAPELVSLLGNEPRPEQVDLAEKPEHAAKLAQMLALLRAEMERLGEISAGPVYYALGRGHMTLQENGEARRHLDLDGVAAGSHLREVGEGHWATDGAQAGAFLQEVQGWLESVDADTPIW